jgi:hypothetical protein
MTRTLQYISNWKSFSTQNDIYHVNLFSYLKGRNIIWHWRFLAFPKISVYHKLVREFDTATAIKYKQCTYTCKYYITIGVCQRMKYCITLFNTVRRLARSTVTSDLNYTQLLHWNVTISSYGTSYILYLLLKRFHNLRSWEIKSYHGLHTKSSSLNIIDHSSLVFMKIRFLCVDRGDF